MPLDRIHQDSVDEVIQNVIPEEPSRRRCLGFLADSIDIAYVLAPDRWGLTIRKDLLRLNVGKIEVLAFFPDAVHCLLDASTIRKELWEDERVDLLENENDPRSGYYKSVPGSVVCNVLAEDFEGVLPLIQDSHRALIENAAQTGRNPMTRKAHCPGAVDYLSTYLGRDIPHPSYR